MKRQYKDYLHEIDYTKTEINIDGIIYGILAVVVAGGIIFFALMV